MNFMINWEQVFRDYADGLMVTDQDFIIRFVNPAFGRLTRKRVEQVAGRPCHDVFADPLCGTAGCPLTMMRHTPVEKSTHAEKHCKLNNQAPWLVTVSPLFDSEGRFCGMIEKISDARELDRVQNELHSSQERMRKTMGAIIQAMSMTIEKRDPYTAGHQRRVAKLCRAIATDLGFSWGRVQGLRMAAAIHDLGKILIPAGILNKPGPMSEHEMGIIRMHPTTAYEILKGIQFPWPLAETIYQHHERLDGSGYPRGLRGDQILLEARILAVADVAESMAFFRPYRPSLGLQEALDELNDKKGILFDTQVAETCIVLFTQKGFDFQTKAWQQRPA